MAAIHHPAVPRPSGLLSRGRRRRADPDLDGGGEL